VNNRLEFLNDCKVVPILPIVAAASADRTSSAIDTDGFEGCAIVVTFGAIAADAVTDIYVSEAEASNLSGKATLAGTSQTVADDDDDQVFIIDIKRPKKRYLALEVNKDATNNTVESAVAILYNSQKRPTANTSQATVNGEFFVSPVAGTK
jgi:hypothetical protein